MKSIGAVVFALLLSGCATSPTTSTFSLKGDPLKKIAAFTTVDLDAADAAAVANNDQIAHACWPALKRFVQAMNGAPAITKADGLFSGYQDARDIRLLVQSGIPDYLKLGCAPMLMDSELFLAQLAALGSGL